MAELQVGRDMDAAVAKAIGWEARECDAPDAEWAETSAGDPQCTACGWIGVWGDHMEHDTPMPYWSQNDADALAALDAFMAQRGGDFILSRLQRINSDGYYPWQADLDLVGDRAACKDGATRAEAICRAILALAEKEGN